MPSTPQIVFGGASLGHEFPTEESVQEVLTLLKDLKITRIDTAARYPPTNHGMSEKLLGITHAGSQGLNISTKIFTTGGDGDGSGELDRASIQKSFSTSLGRLGVDQVDVLYIHRPDPTTPLKVQAAAFDELFKEGKIKRLGLSNFKPELLQEYLDVCDENAFVKPTVYQGDYNVITRVPLLRALAGGFLTGKFSSGQYEGTRFSDDHVLGKYFQNLYSDPKLQQAMKNFESAITPFGISGSEASIRWIFYHSALGEQDAVILGASKLAQIKDSVRSISVGPLPDGVVQAIESIWGVLEESRAAC
ncbi:Oxidoreductase [Lachnellula occidentalis]|uniref:Oxidoreductase n=1 Tax=Lachnellula occidentalis TaxID=215460 RepID=A0A8H8UK10_9HELO|nr:Oxidoreductase [Lachnellula occidentalis]